MFSSWRRAETSSIRCRVVLSVSAAVASSSLALGVLFPQPRWSNRMTRYRCGSKNRATETWLPDGVVIHFRKVATFWDEGVHEPCVKAPVPAGTSVLGADFITDIALFSMEVEALQLK